MSEYSFLIPQNIATKNARRIGIYNEHGNRVGQIPLGSLTPPNPEERLYSFGALSDVHIQYDTAQDDFVRALTYLKDNEKVDFVCISGDLTSDGTNEHLAQYKACVDAYAGNMPVYAVAGNHEAYRGSTLESVISQYTGHPLYYSFEYGNDVFVMVGVRGNSENNLFTDAELTWLADTLETYKNKRVFLFQHVRPQDGCGNALGIYNNDIWGGDEAVEFERLLRRYPNTIHFHGHSHIKFALQELDKTANIDRLYGGWSVHIPSLAAPRGTTSVVNPSITDIYAESEGYVVDVYESGIHLRGRDFVKGEFLPIASYWLDTTLQTIPAGTYKDSTGTIVT